MLNEEQMNLIADGLRGLQADNLEWLKARPPLIQQAIWIRPPMLLYLLNGDQLVYITCYEEPLSGDIADVTVRIAYTRQFNVTDMERQVFGIPLDDLIPVCHKDDSKQYEIDWEDGAMEEMDAREERLMALIEETHKTIPEGIVGPLRAEIIFKAVREFEEREGFMP